MNEKQIKDLTERIEVLEFKVAYPNGKLKECKDRFFETTYQYMCYGEKRTIKNIPFPFDKIKIFKIQFLNASYKGKKIILDNARKGIAFIEINEEKTFYYISKEFGEFIKVPKLENPYWHYIWKKEEN
jgi:hypothetical protein